jgi:hypothetical protein
MSGEEGSIEEWVKIAERNRWLLKPPIPPVTPRECEAERDFRIEQCQGCQHYDRCGVIKYLGGMDESLVYGVVGDEKDGG